MEEFKEFKEFGGRNREGANEANGPKIGRAKNSVRRGGG
jgi:hypothetical protein